MKAQPPRGDASAIISRGADILGIHIDRNQLALMVRYIQIIMKWQCRLSLTSLTEPADMATLLFLDALTVFKVLPAGTRAHIIDIGTGAGFPGLVLRIVDASVDVTLVDRDPRKIVFLKHVVHELKLTGVKFLNTALDDLVKRPLELRFDVAVSRAFSSDPKVLDSLASLLWDDGTLIRMAGPSSLAKDFSLNRFAELVRWEGTLPLVSRYRRVIAYRRIS